MRVMRRRQVAAVRLRLSTCPLRPSAASASTASAFHTACPRDLLAGARGSAGRRILEHGGEPAPSSVMTPLLDTRARGGRVASGKEVRPDAVGSGLQ